LAALGSLFLAGVAQAHSRPVRFDPAPGAVLAAAPSSVTGWFTSDLRRAEESFIQVLDHDGANVAAGDIQLSEDRRQMSVALESGVGEGRYVVYWSTFDDADGEVFGGCYAFFVGQAAADEAVSNGEALDGGADCPAPAEGHVDPAAPPAGSEPAVAVEVAVSGSTAVLNITPTNFTARAPDGSTVDPNFGHYHIYLDKVPVDLIAGSHGHDEEGEEMDEHDAEAGEDPNGLIENPLMWAENDYTFSELRPGVHTVTVGLTYDNHELFDPPVLATQTFVIEGGDSGDGGIPAWALVVAIAGGLVVGGVGMKLVGGRA
jgi:hypothetical protein